MSRLLSAGRARGLTAVALLALCATARGDDHANTAAQGTPLTAGGAIAGFLDAGDVDWFRFPAQAGAVFRLETEGPNGDVDTLLAVYNPTGGFVREDDDSGAGRLSRLQVTTNVAGTWLVRVRHYEAAGTGAYRVRLTQLSGPTTPTTPTTPTSAHAIDAARVFDPKLEGAALEVRTRAAGSDAYRATLSVVTAGGALVRELTAGAQRQAQTDYTDRWDGKDGQGRVVAPGRHVLRLVVERNGARETSERDVHVARLGAVSIAFSDPGDLRRVPLTYHGSAFPIDGAGAAWALNLSTLGPGCLDAADGRALAGPDPWTDLARPPRSSTGAVPARGRSLPVAYALGARPRVQVALGSQAASNGAAVAAGWPIAGRSLRLVVQGVASGELLANQNVILDLPALTGGVGRQTLDLELRFEAKEDTGAWRAVPGLQRARVTLYRTLGRPPRGQAWVQAVDLAVGFAQGTTDARGLLSGIVRGVNGQMWLSYDTAMGASAYVPNGDYALELGAVLDGRRNGTIVNCTDCGSLVSALGNHCGVDARVVTIGYDFQLNWLRGIGGTQFIHDLFGGMHAFSYHDWASLDRGASVHDACLSVDDDGNPRSAPFVEGLPQGMSYDRYMRALTPDYGASGSFGSWNVVEIQALNAVAWR